MQTTLRLFILLALMTCISLPLQAQDISERCQTEPTDVAIAYGDALTCAIEPVGDSDIFRFFGNIGDRVNIESVDAAGASAFGMCVELIGPDGATLADQCENTDGQRVDMVLNQEGVHTIITHDFGDDRQGIYNLSLSCLLGACTSPDGDADIAVTPPNFDFGPVNLNTASTPVVFLVSNVVDLEDPTRPRLTINPITLEGPQAGDFTILTDTCSSRFIPAGLSCQVEVGFTPTTLGGKTATLMIPSNDPDTPVLQVNLSGSGQGGPPDAIGGSVTGVTPTTVVCTNLITGQSVTIPNSAASWDCEGAGLTANPGDEIVQSVFGMAQ